MAGRVEGVSDGEWRLFEDVFPSTPTKRGRGMPHAPFRKILNTLLYVLITGCRWCDVPRGLQWASKSATHRWLRCWQTDGTLAAMQARILGVAEEKGMIRWEYGAVDGAFPPCDLHLLHFFAVTGFSRLPRQLSAGLPPSKSRP